MESPFLVGLLNLGGSRLILALAFALAIGFSLAIFGSGGSIITLPVLVYAAGVPTPQAVGMSLAIVGGTGLVATVINARKGLVHVKAAALFSVMGIGGAFGGAQLTHLVSARVLLLAFAGLMVAVGLLMLQQKKDPIPDPAKECRWQRCSATGFVVGVVTGLLGVGGGFLLVPAMVMFGRLPLKLAVGTSLLIISVNSLSGLAAHFQRNPFNLKIASMFLGMALLGMFAGRHFTGRVAEEKLRRGFAWFVLGAAAFVIAKNLPPVVNLT